MVLRDQVDPVPHDRGQPRQMFLPELGKTSAPITRKRQVVGEMGQIVEGNALIASAAAWPLPARAL